jgi:creatinine amidohydrolase
MLWEDLTAPNFAQAVKDVQGVCLVPVGIIEKHGEHLPLGTDHFRGRYLAEAAAAIEPVIIFPSYYFSQIQEARHQPGAIGLSPGMIFDLLEEVCGEIARNGMHKIILLNTHGGNRFFLPHFARSMLYKRKDFVTYVPNAPVYRPHQDPEWQKMRDETHDGHAGEVETSEMLHIDPSLVKMNEFGGDGKDHVTRAEIPDAFTGFNNYAAHPDHYCGDGRSATPEKGKYLYEWAAPRLAKVIRDVKDDELLPRLARQFYDQLEKPLETPRNL